MKEVEWLRYGVISFPWWLKWVFLFLHLSSNLKIPSFINVMLFLSMHACVGRVGCLKGLSEERRRRRRKEGAPHWQWRLHRRRLPVDVISPASPGLVSICYKWRWWSGELLLWERECEGARALLLHSPGRRRIWPPPAADERSNMWVSKPEVAAGESPAAVLFLGGGGAAEWDGWVRQLGGVRAEGGGGKERQAGVAADGDYWSRLPLELSY